MCAGVIKAGEEIEIIGLKDTIKSTVTGVEMFKKNLNQVITIAIVIDTTGHLQLHSQTPCDFHHLA